MWKQLTITDADKIMVIKKNGAWETLADMLKGSIVLMDYCERDELKVLNVQAAVDIAGAAADSKKEVQDNAVVNADVQKQEPEKKESEKMQQESVDTKNIWENGKVKFSYEEMLETLKKDCKDPKEIIRMKGVCRSDKAVLLKELFNWATDHIAQELGIKRETVQVYLYQAKSKAKEKKA